MHFARNLGLPDLAGKEIIGREKGAPHWGVQSRFRVIYVYVIAQAGVIFGIYFTRCRYSGS